MAPHRATCARSLFALFVVLVLGAPSCASGPHHSAPGDARDALVQFVEATARQLEVAGWNRDGVAVPSTCSRGVLGDGVKWSYGYGAPQPDADRQADARVVLGYWQSLGTSASIMIDGVGNPDVYGQGGPVESVAFHTAPGDYYITGTSLCVPGDAREEYLKIPKAR